MNRTIINLITTLALAILLSTVLPWWSIMVAALMAALIVPLKKTAAFFIPFLTISIYWGTYCYLLSSPNDFILTEKIAVLVPFGGNPYLLIAFTGVLGGISAGVSGLLGKELHEALKGT